MKIKDKTRETIKDKLDAARAAVEAAQTDNFLKEKAFDALEDAKRMIEDVREVFA